MLHPVDQTEPNTTTKPCGATYWPVCNDRCLYGSWKSTADSQHVGSELNDEVLETEWSMYDDAIEERYYFRCTTARSRLMYELCVHRHTINQSVS